MAAQIDQPGSAIDAYIDGLRDVLERKAANIAQLQGRLENFQVLRICHTCQCNPKYPSQSPENEHYSCGMRQAS